MIRAAGPQGQRRAVAWLVCLVPLVMGLLAITDRSFWIDECVTAEYVSQPTFTEWRHDLLTTDYAEAQMPFYLLYLWCWEKIFGPGEWSLRAAALPWFVAGVGLFLHALRGLLKPGWVAAAVTFGSAFVWYYLDEARLYSMQFGAACAIVGSLILLVREQGSTEPESEGVDPERQAVSQRAHSAALPGRERWWWCIFLVSTVVLSGISIIGMLWAGAGVLVLGLALRPVQLWNRVRSSPLMLIVSAVVLLGLAAFYIASVMRGARASSLATTNLQTLVYVGYELFGFAGLGPGRGALRDQGIQALIPHLPILGVFAGSLSVVLAAGCISIWKSAWRPRAVWMGVAVSLPAVFLLATGVLRHFRVLGRHFTPLLAVLLVVLALGAARLWNHGRWGRIAVALYLGLALLSALQVRLAPRHFKDDYRAAAAFSADALSDGRRVWWAAAPQGADYYRLPLTEDPAGEGRAYAIFGPRAEELTGVPLPDYVVLSRPDIYDHQGGLAVVLNDAGFLPYTNFPGFKMWVRPR